ncbi:endoplasmic oxidoreductin-1 family protein [Onchocerca flexuosa]|uniref:Endoplasmic oxidoreductin-1 family protein n=2 Tax=Onchocerca flexuosa TaxID=387005 RepID=A0A238C4X7_9BILA|nr:endoplasmic oxidoreductin-1 family protein [Onchocerca flexuosa]
MSVAKRICPIAILAPTFVLLLLCVLEYKVWAQLQPDKDCFCKSLGLIDDCRCTAESIDDFNNYEVFPILQQLLTRDFFKFYKVNMEKECPFWPDDRMCMSKECGIGYCDDEVPSGLKQPVTISVVRSELNRTFSKNNSVITQIGGVDSTCKKEESNAFDPLDTTLTEGDRQQLNDMDWHDENQDKFCDFEDEESADMHYVDLSRNPERYTGYKGDSAQKVWTCIYQENCFKPNMKFDKNFLIHPNSFGMCFEKRVFYRLISGLHSAITISIASNSFKPNPAGFEDGMWFRNTELFKNRFVRTLEGPQRLKNVYFVYLLELRALVKAAPYFRKELFYTGNPKDDAKTRETVEKLMNTLKKFNDPFDETEMFTGVEATARELREEFRQHFFNISRIMDCVGCDKCRLWGKLQTHGMGTALKILFSDLPTSHYKTKDGTIHPPFQLTRNEVVSLFQSFGRYASSIREIDEFRRALT